MSLMHALAMQKLRGDNDLTNLCFGSFIDIPDAPPVDPAYVEDWLKMRGLKSYVILRVHDHHYHKYWRVLPLPVVGGLNGTEVSILQGSDEPVFLVFCWLHRQLVARRREGGIKEDAPIVSRIYQVLSDGMLGFENARKLCDTPFPFPYAQCVSLLLHLNSLGMPLLMANWIGEAWLTGVVTFVTVFAFYVINEVAREIEDPFKFEPNDIPLPYLQHKFNARLVTAFVTSLLPETGLFGHIHSAEIKLLIANIRPQARPEDAQGGSGIPMSPPTRDRVLSDIIRGASASASFAFKDISSSGVAGIS